MTAPPIRMPAPGTREQRPGRGQAGQADHAGRTGGSSCGFRAGPASLMAGDFGAVVSDPVAPGADLRRLIDQRGPALPAVDDVHLLTYLP
jgi:hypothetical protein